MLDTKLLDNLEEKLAALTGYDFEIAEKEERIKGNNAAPDMSLTKGFQARLAARALGVPMQDVQELSAREYNLITERVFNFLFNTSETNKELSENDSPSIVSDPS